MKNINHRTVLPSTKSHNIYKFLDFSQFCFKILHQDIMETIAYIIFKIYIAVNEYVVFLFQFFVCFFCYKGFSYSVKAEYGIPFSKLKNATKNYFVRKTKIRSLGYDIKNNNVKSKY